MLVAFVLGSAAFGQNEVASKEPIKVHIALNRTNFHLGEPIELMLEISNVGQEPLIIANSVSLFGNDDAFLEIELRRKKKLQEQRFGFAADCFQLPEKNPKPPSEILLKSFLVLRPGTSYAQRLPLYDDLNALEHGLKPGSYSLKTYYSSSGLHSPSMCGTQGLTEDDVESLPFRTWRGKVSTNEISFTILPPA
jgi:hypothetical protein